MEEEVRLSGVYLRVADNAQVERVAVRRKRLRIPWGFLHRDLNNFQPDTTTLSLEEVLQSDKTTVSVKAFIQVRQETVPASIAGTTKGQLDKTNAEWSFPDLEITWNHPALRPTDNEPSCLNLEFTSQYGVSAKGKLLLGSVRVDLHTIATGPVRQDLPLSGPPRAAKFRTQCDLIYRQTSSECFFRVNHQSPLAIKWNDDLAVAPKRPYVGIKYGDSSSMTTTPSRSGPCHWAMAEVVGCKVAVPQTLADILRASVTIQVHDEADSNKMLGMAVIKIFDFWHASFPDMAGAPFQLRLRGPRGDLVGSITGSLLVRSVPDFHQMIGGVRNEDGISNARPLVFGVPLPNGTHPSRTIRAWDTDGDRVRLVDSFGLQYYYDFHTRACVWKRSDDSTSGLPVESELQKTFGSGSQTTWIHPNVDSISLLDPANDVSQFGAAEPIMIRRNRNVLFAEEAAAKRAAETQSNARDLSLTDDSGCATDMRFTHLGHVRQQSQLNAGSPSEGHSLAVVNDWREVVKFGGGNGIEWFNDTHIFDIQRTEWRRAKTVGTIPRGRTGHGVAVLGSQSRMALFGGASQKGRLNDLHIYNTVRCSWTPVNVELSPIGRARMGMVPSASDDGFWVFGGRQGYNYLGDKYFNDLHLFDASSVQWIPVRPTTTALPTRRCGMIAELIDYRLLFIHGGYEDGNVYYDDTWLFDTVSYQWVRPPYQDPNMIPCGRESHASSVVANSVVMLGGESDVGYHNDVQVFDIITKRWVGRPFTSGHSPGGRTGAATVAIDDRRLLLVGGDQGLRFTNDSLTLDVAHARVSDLGSIRRRLKEHGPNSEVCCVCMERDTSETFLWCGHSVCCFRCAARMKTCPICRSFVSRTSPINAP